MGQISQQEAADLLHKFITERIRVQAYFISQKTRVNLTGFVDSVTMDNGIVVSVSGPPIDVSRGYVSFHAFGGDCDFHYGEKRELPDDLQRVSEDREDSVLLFSLRDSGERFALFFTT